MTWYFLGEFCRISDGHPYPFYASDTRFLASTGGVRRSFKILRREIKRLQVRFVLDCEVIIRYSDVEDLQLFQDAQNSCANGQPYERTVNYKQFKLKIQIQLKILEIMQAKKKSIKKNCSASLPYLSRTLGKLLLYSEVLQRRLFDKKIFSLWFLSLPIQTFFVFLQSSVAKGFLKI